MVSLGWVVSRMPLRSIFQLGACLVRYIYFLEPDAGESPEEISSCVLVISLARNDLNCSKRTLKSRESAC